MRHSVWLVTGGAGFIGSHIAEELVRRGEKVRIFDNFSAGTRENIAGFQDKCDVFEGDLRSTADLGRAMRGADFVIHQAAFRSVPESVEDPYSAHENNATGTLNALMAAREAGVKRFVYAGTSAVYGDGEIYPQNESLPVLPVSPYAASKLAGELYCRVYAETMGLETVSLRYFNVFGPRQSLDSKYAVVIPKFMYLAAKEKPLEIHWDGRQSRDFTYVDNVVEGNILAALAPSSVSGEVFNIADGINVSLLEVAAELEKLTGRDLHKEFYPKRAGDLRKTYADISKAEKMLGYVPRVNFSDGLRRTWNYFSVKFAEDKK